MKLSCLQENMKRGLATVSHAVTGKSTMPILANILLATDQGRLKLAATNLDITITCWIGAQVEQEGAITVPARLLNDVVGSLPNDTITLSLDARTQTINLTCARFTTNIKGMDADDFPPIPTVVDRSALATLPASLLREVIDQVAFAAASDDSRPVLAGVLIRLRGTEAAFVATDGFRLAKRTITLPEPVAASQEVIVPAHALSELGRIIDDTDTVFLVVTPEGNQVLFHTESTDLVSRLIDGKFPDFERIIPTHYATRTVLETRELTKAVKLASFFTNPVEKRSIVKLTMEPGAELNPGTLTVSANAAEVGDNTGELDAMIDGEGGQIALNVKYLAEALNAIKTFQVAIETQTPQSPGVFKPVCQDRYVHIIMPVTIR